MSWNAELVKLLEKFLDAAAGEGLVLDSVDAADLYREIFMENGND